MLLALGVSAAACGAPDPPALPTPVSAASEIEVRNERLAAAAPPAATRDHDLGVNDVLGVSVLEAPELDRSVRVSATGMVALPLIGTLKAAGVPLSTFEDQVRERLRVHIIDPHVTVTLEEVHSNPVSVLGAVLKPGTYQVRGAPTLLEALSLAGGLAQEAGTAVTVRTGGAPDGSGAMAEEVREVDLDTLLARPGGPLNARLGPGAVVHVRPAGAIYAVGEFHEPGSFDLAGRRGITVLQAVALAQGLTPNAAKGRARIIRETPDGRLEIPVDLGDVLRGDVPDPPLRENDVVFVPRSTGRALVSGFFQAVLRVVTFRGIF